MIKKGLILLLILSLFSITLIAANTIDSSTMYFQGSLTYRGGGTYEGIVDALPGTYYMFGGDGCSGGLTPDGSVCAGGFDVYAKESGVAYVGPDNWTIGSDHDAYSSSGPWGTWYDPDVPDYHNYDLEIDGNQWSVHGFRGAGAPNEIALGGILNWDLMYANENEQNWNPTWTWGEENIPLQYPGFELFINETSPGIYDVILTPAGRLEIYNKTNVTCAYNKNNITLETYIRGVDSPQQVLFTYTIDGTSYNKTAINQGNGRYSYTLLSSELVGSQYLTWNVYAQDSYDYWYLNGEKSFYINNQTTLIINPANPNGLNNWYITEPLFSMSADSLNGGPIYYRWDADDIYAYTGPFRLEDIPNQPNITAGTLELNWWTDFGACENESINTQMFYIDLTDPEIKNIQPEDGEEVINNLRPTISAYLDEVHQSNSGINESSILIKLNDLEVVPMITNKGIDSSISYTPNSDLTEGMHTVYISVNDNAGRFSELTWSFEINNSASKPIITINDPKNQTYDSRRIPFNISVSKEVYLEYINYDESRPIWRRLCSDCESYGLERLRIKTLREGENTIGIRATDNYGQIDEETITLTIDSRKPRISRTEPRSRTYLNKNTILKVRYTEDNLKQIQIFWGNNTDVSSKILTGCEAGTNKECSTTLGNSLNYEGQEIEYWFEISDSINTVQSRKTIAYVDTIAPILIINEPINDSEFRRRVPFNLSVSEEVTLEYKDISDTRPSWRRLCSRCEDYGLDRNRERSFRQGDHYLEIRATDKAGNSDIEKVSFEINYFLL